MRTKRVFLKRIKNEQVTKQNLVIGRTLSIYSRLFKITDYANDYTRQQLQQSYVQSETMLIVKPDGLTRLAEIVQMVESEGL